MWPSRIWGLSNMLGFFLKSFVHGLSNTGSIEHGVYQTFIIILFFDTFRHITARSHAPLGILQHRSSLRSPRNGWTDDGWIAEWDCRPMNSSTKMDWMISHSTSVFILRSLPRGRSPRRSRRSMRIQDPGSDGRGSAFYAKCKNSFAN